MERPSERGSKILAVDVPKREFGGPRAVDGCSFSVAAGTITGLIDPNGAGNSTLFNLVNRFFAVGDSNVGQWACPAPHETLTT